MKKHKATGFYYEKTQSYGGSGADNFISKNASGYAQFHLLSNARSVG
jgi:hypothetical protein